MQTRFQRLKDKEARKLVGIILAGKMAGLVVLLGAFKGVNWYLDTAAGAQTDTVVHKANDFVSPINTVWVLIAAFLVFFMQAGFMGLEAGFARSRETVNVLLECVFDTCLCGLLYWSIGFAFQFGAGNGFIGHEFFFLNGAPASYGSTGVAFLAFWLFQFAFADTASTITSGAMVGRTSFKGDILYSTMVSGFIYPIFGHWVWGPGGWLQSGSGSLFEAFGTGGAFFRDFAGSTVVHTVGGAIALAGAIALGPRLGRTFKRDGGGPMPAHDLTWGAIGGVILWFGWYGFNPGSTLSAMDWEGIGRVATNTTLAACAGGLLSVLIVYPKTKKWDLGISVNGFLGGLVGITAPCYWVSPFGAVVIGGIAGIVVVYGIQLLEHFRIDDPIGAVPVHMFCGIWGTLAIGLFAVDKYGFAGPDGADNTTPVKGLFYGGGVDQLKAQLIGSIACVLVVGSVALIVMFAIRQLKGSWNLRLERDLELEGLDIAEHGTPAYHMEFGYGMSYTTPTGSTLPGSSGSRPVDLAESDNQPV